MASIRQHWFVIVPPIVWSVLVMSVLVLVSLYVQFDFFGYAAAIYAFASMGILFFLLYRFSLWRRNRLIITNQRLIDEKQAGLFDRTVTELLYKDITDVSFTQNGPVAATYDYGTLTIHLPSQNQVVVEQIPAPGKVIEIINQIRQAGTVVPMPAPAPSQ